MNSKLPQEPRIKRKDIALIPIRGYVSIKNLLNYHKRCLGILKFIKNKEPRLAMSICLINFESLAKVIYPRKESSSKRFILLLSKIMSKKEAKDIYHFYRIELVHGGTLNPLYDNIEDMEDAEEMGNKENIVFFDKKSIDTLSDLPYYPLKTFIIIYKELVEYVQKYFKRKKLKSRIIYYYTYKENLK